MQTTEPCCIHLHELIARQSYSHLASFPDLLLFGPGLGMRLILTLTTIVTCYHGYKNLHDGMFDIHYNSLGGSFFKPLRAVCRPWKGCPIFWLQISNVRSKYLHNIIHCALCMFCICSDHLPDWAWTNPGPLDISWWHCWFQQIHWGKVHNCMASWVAHKNVIGPV